jgi:hypothetical protein
MTGNERISQAASLIREVIQDASQSDNPCATARIDTALAREGLMRLNTPRTAFAYRIDAAEGWVTWWKTDSPPSTQHTHD